jgi:hypothetical protein
MKPVAYGPHSLPADQTMASWRRCTRRLVLVLLLSPPAAAAPPPDADPTLHIWFERQRSVRGVLCCSIADGHILGDDEWRTNGSFYEVYIQGEWHRIQPTQLRDPAGGPNPTGHAVVWYTVRDRLIIYCFAPGVEL